MDLSFDQEIEQLLTLSKVLNDKSIDLIVKAQALREESREAHQRALSLMTEAGVLKTSTTNYIISMRNNPTSVRITNPDKLPPEAFITKTEPSKSKIKELLKQGKDVDGAELSSDGMFLVVKDKKGG